MATITEERPPTRWAAEATNVADMRRSRRRGRCAAILAVLGGTTAISGHATLYGNWIIDDAAITFAYARSVSEGLGPVLQPGVDPVEGFSNPTWLLLLALGRVLGLFDHGTIAGIPDYVLFPKALALLCCAGILTLCHLIYRRMLNRAWVATAVTGLFLACVPSFVIWSFSGLENSLYALSVTALATVLVRAALDDRLLAANVAVVSGLLAAFAGLTRPDGMVYAAAYPIVAAVVLRGRWAPVLRRAALSVVVFVLPVGTYLAWRLVTFGRWVPNTSIAKKQSVPGPANLVVPGELVDYIGAPLLLFVAVGIGALLPRRPWWWSGVVALLVSAALAVTAYAVLRPDWMKQHRFATPFWVLGVLVGVLVCAELFRRYRGRRVLVIGSSALVVAVSGSVASHAELAWEFRDQADVPACYVADRLGRGFNGYADILGVEHGSLLLPDLGGSAMTSRLRLVDMAGLADAEIANYMRDRDMPGLRDHVFEDVKPTFIHSRGPWSAGNGIPSDPRLERDYVPLYEYANNHPPNGDWVRKDVVRDAESLERAREYGRTRLAHVDRGSRGWDRRHCGETLHVGQTRVAQLVLD